ncbi:MAG: L-2-amino-thiazoline-4-carboxylic acid hydrolase [Alphaproteobacteria bacterium]
MSEIPVIIKRRLQAQVIKPIYDEMAAAVGVEKAKAILDSAIRKAAIAEGKEFAAKEPGGITSLAGFIDLYKHWKADGALEVEVLKANDEVFDFNVTRCRYAEMYREMGLHEIGALMSCNRDGTFCEGYDPNIKLDRSQTIMGGASHCTFRYRYEKATRT